MALYLTSYHEKSARLRAKLLKNEEERLQIEQKLRSMSTVDARLQNRQTLDQIQDYFTRLNQESQQAEERNRRILNDLTRAEGMLDQIRVDAEKLFRLKREYADYIQSTKPLYDFDRSRVKSQGDIDTPDVDYSTSESTTLSRSKRPSSLRMELTRTGLYFLMDYLEKEFVDAIDKKKFYQHDPPTISQKQRILTIGNDQQQQGFKELDPTTTSMVILDQLPSTIRRTTLNQCLLTEEILKGNVNDMNVHSIGRRIPEQDRILWNRLMDHLMKVYKYHILTSDVLAQKFASALLPVQSVLIQDKAKNVLKYLVEHQPGNQSSSSDEELSTKKGNSSWLAKAMTRKSLDEDSSSSSSVPSRRNIPSTSTTPRQNPPLDDSDLDFYS